MTTILEMARVETPLGTVHCAVRDGRLCALEFADRWQHRLAWLQRRLGPLTTRLAPDPAGIAGRLTAYFAGSADAFDGIELELFGTPFQRRVWTALRDVPAGRTVSYGALARTVCVPSAARAVGAANGANPIAIVVPCHRVVGADGALTGYAGGLERKRWLLEHERQWECPALPRLSAPTPPPAASAPLPRRAAAVS